MSVAIGLAVLALADLPPPPPVTAAPPPPAATESVSAAVAASAQLLVVTTPSWDAKAGTLRRYARPAADALWAPVGPEVKIVVGASGLGWGLGLHGGSGGVDEPRKMEGDERAPAGVFALGEVLGKLSAPKTRLKARQLKQGDVCVDDATHPLYNHIVAAGAEKTWKSAEQLYRKDWLYDSIVVIDQNHAESGAPVAGRGSCVFLHVWRKEGSGTAGCTAMEKGELQEIIAWLDPAARPLLVQVPRGVYIRVKETWGLP